VSDAHRFGEVYWSLIEPDWLRLNYSLDAAPDEFMRQYQATRVKVARLYAGHWCQSEVCNGGLFQFFHNTTGILAPEAIDAFEAIGIPEWSQILREAIAFFPKAYPRDRRVRLSLLPEWKRNRKEPGVFTKLDDRFYAWLDDENDRWERTADIYAGTA